VVGKIGLDTSFLVDFLKGVPEAVKFMNSNRYSLVICEFVIYEFLCGNLSKKREEEFLVLADIFPSISLSREVAQQASHVYREAKRRGRSVDHQDCLVAGSYLAEGISQIITRNKKHFASFKKIKVLGY